MNSTKRPKLIEAVPCKMSLPAVPIFSEQELPARLSRNGAEGKRIEGLPIRGLRTQVTNFDDALRRTESTLAHYREMVSANPWAITELLAKYPDLMVVPWVKEAFYSAIRSGKGGGRRGRPFGSFAVYPLAVLGLVEGLIRCGEAKKPEPAFHRIAELGILTYGACKSSYYQALKEERFRPIAITFEHAKRLITESDMRKHMNGEPCPKLDGGLKDVFRSL